MTKTGTFFAIGLISLFTTGCAVSPLSPDMNNKINNQQGEIEELKNIQNGMNTEIGKMRNESEIRDSQFKDLQQGFINMKLSSNENSGVQILQGDGALILVFATVVVSIIFIYQYMATKKATKTADILAAQIAKRDDEEELEEVFKACMFTNVESDVYDLISKHQKKYRDQP